MSKIGKKPVSIPENTSVANKDMGVKVRGPKGEVTVMTPKFVRADVAPGRVTVLLDGSVDNATLGRVRSEIANAVHGVTEGWTKTLEIVGTGYRATTDGKKLILSLGFSHPVELFAPEGIQFQVAANKITVTGVDKVLVGEIAATIRRFREVEPYKGKGLRYENEVVRKKQGKAAKGAGSQ